jgi:hypothetical protein
VGLAEIKVILYFVKILENFQPFMSKIWKLIQYHTNDISTQPKLNSSLVQSYVIVVNHLKHKYTKKLITDVLSIIIFFTYRKYEN